MPYSAVIHPRPCPLIHTGTRPSRDAVHSTWVSPKRAMQASSACRVAPGSSSIVRTSSAARPDGRVMASGGSGGARPQPSSYGLCWKAYPEAGEHVEFTHDSPYRFWAGTLPTTTWHEGSLQTSDDSSGTQRTTARNPADPGGRVCPLALDCWLARIRRFRWPLPFQFRRPLAIMRITPDGPVIEDPALIGDMVHTAAEPGA